MPGNGRTAHSPVPYGLTASGPGCAYGPPATCRSGQVVDGSELSPLAADRLGGTERRQPRCAPDPPGGGIDEHGSGGELVRLAGLGFRVDTARHRQVLARIAGAPRCGYLTWSAAHQIPNLLQDGASVVLDRFSQDTVRVLAWLMSSDDYLTELTCPIKYPYVGPLIRREEGRIVWDMTQPTVGKALTDLLHDACAQPPCALRLPQRPSKDRGDTTTLVDKLLDLFIGCRFTTSHLDLSYQVRAQEKSVI